ncbi:MAG: flagellar filament capping protein FliD [Bryobacterales bacterium]|nr:flagellar filament capping protein FliD [Bryobacteraceae bacterium]MDW8131989.1 flagellar filament capping protein FliD [Bryobacterales bacterium]
MAENTLFTGTSRYAADFQGLIERAVAIASLPLKQLQSVRNSLQAQSSALAKVREALEALGSALDGLERIRGAGGYMTAVSNGAVLSASAGPGATLGVWSVEVTSLGAWTSTLSKDTLPKVTDPNAESISTAASFTLTVNGEAARITPMAGTLAALVEAINRSGLDVEASVVNVGGSSGPDYRLAIRSTKLAAVSIQLADDAGELLDTLAMGAPAAYKVNGMATVIESDSRTVTLAPGLTITLLGKSDPGVAATVTVSRSSTALNSALAAFASAYNAAVEALDAHRGQAGGALAGQSIVRTLSEALRQAVSYQAGSGQLRTLTDLGLRFDDKGKLSLDSAALDGVISGGWQALLDFLGTGSDTGFLTWARSVTETLLDSDKGVLSLATKSLRDEIAAQDGRIEAEQERIERVREDLVSRISAADAMIAAMEQKALYITNLFESMRIAAKMYSP